MTDIRPVWTPDDFDQCVRDAQAIVDAGRRRRGLSVVADSERVTNVEPQRQSATKLGNGLIFSRSRFRRAKILDGLAVALLLILAAVFGIIAVLLAAPHAKADDMDPESVAYAAHYASAVCSTLDDYPSVNGLIGIMTAIEDDGLTARQAGQAVGLSVTEVCPRYGYLLDLFVARYGGSSVA